MAQEEKNKTKYWFNKTDYFCYLQNDEWIREETEKNRLKKKQKKYWISVEIEHGALEVNSARRFSIFLINETLYSRPKNVAESYVSFESMRRYKRLQVALVWIFFSLH